MSVLRNTSVDCGDKPGVVIFATHILYASNTFITTQAEAMTRITPFYAGVRLIRELPLPPERTLVINRGGILGRLRELAYKSCGVSPRLKGSVARIRPVVIHAHFGPSGVRALPLARSVGAPLIVTFHGDDAALSDAGCAAAGYSYRVYLRHRHDLVKSAVRFIAVSRFIAEQLIRQGFPPEKVFVHYIGVNTDALRADSVVRRSPVVLFVGRLVEKKGCEHLLYAMAGVQRRLPHSELLIVGDGPLRPDLEAQARQTLQHFRFLGIQTPDIVREHMKRSSVLAVPSIRTDSGAAEGLPTVLMEALALNLPVVATTSAGIPEAITDGDNGFLVPERDHALLEQRITTLLTNRELWSQFSLAGRRRAERDFNVRRQSAVLEDLYFEVTRTLSPLNTVAEALGVSRG